MKQLHTLTRIEIMNIVSMAIFKFKKAYYGEFPMMEKDIKIALPVYFQEILAYHKCMVDKRFQGFKVVDGYEDSVVVYYIHSPEFGKEDNFVIKTPLTD